MYKQILVGLDGSEASWKALGSALELAKLNPGSEVCAVSVEEHLPRMPEVLDELAEERERENAIFAPIQAQAVSRAAEVGVVLRVKTMAGHAAQTIVRLAEQDQFDLVVIGHSGRSGVWGTFLGGTADKIVRHANCTVLVVR